jgi:hypothetical protein
MVVSFFMVVEQMSEKILARINLIGSLQIFAVENVVYQSTSIRYYYGAFYATVFLGFSFGKILHFLSNF